MNIIHPYFLYGLHVASDLSLPELPIAKMGQPDVFFRRAGVAGSAPEYCKPLGPFHAAVPGELWLQVPEIARFLVLNGREVRFDPLPGADEADLRTFLLGPCLAALLMQRGLLVLRGCAVRIGDGCAVVLGEPASGKSILAAVLAKRGHAVLSDDMVVFDGENRVLPGVPCIKLWSDAIGKLGLDITTLQRTRPCLEKFYWPVESSLRDGPLPAHSVYLLRTSGKNCLYLDNVHGMERFACLLEYVYRQSYLEATGARSSYLRQCAGLAGSVEMKILYRKKFLPSAEEMADLILADAEGRA